MRTVAIISFSDLSRDPRVERQIRTICSIPGLSVVTVGMAKPTVVVGRHVTVVPLPSNLKRRFVSAALLLERRYEDYYAWTYQPARAVSELQHIPLDLVIGNDFSSLPLAYRLARAKRSRLLLDAHEFAPRQGEERLRWKIFLQPYNYYLGRRYLSELDGMITVSEGIAREYQRSFAVTPQVITNAPPFSDLTPSEVKDGKIRLVYHGAASPTRRIERIIDAMRMVRTGTTLDMLLLPLNRNKSYFHDLQRLVCGRNNIRLLPPIPMSDLVASCNEYDAGICFLPASNFNQKHALPNKFFEYIQSRLALVIGPSPEMVHYVRNYDLGNVAKDFTPRALAQAINELTKDSIIRFKSNADAASKILSAESNSKLLVKIIEGLLD